LLSPVDYTHIRSLTSRMHEDISTGTLDSPSWEILRSAKLAARIYAPLGTRMSLGDFVRLVKTYIDAFKTTQEAVDEADKDHEEERNKAFQLCHDLKVRHTLLHFLIVIEVIPKGLPRSTFTLGGQR
jgi:glycerol-3-phosphate O-acyltransferase/dihydroxyacetone phosphate acyltransferase